MVHEKVNTMFYISFLVFIFRTIWEVPLWATHALKKTVMWKVLYHAKQWGHECCTFWRSFHNILSSTYKLNFQNDISFFLFSIDKFLRYLKLLVSPFLLLESNCDCNTIETTHAITSSRSHLNLLNMWGYDRFDVIFEFLLEVELYRFQFETPQLNIPFVSFGLHKWS